MRNFEERKAEVFRRSENRIKERRRNRNRILTLCIPLCLVLTVWSVATLPSRFAQKNNDGEYEGNGNIYGDTAPESAGDSIEESQTHNFVSVSVKGMDYEGEITDAAGVRNVFDNIYNILEANVGYKDIIGGSSVNAVDDENEDVGEESTIESEQYIITMKSFDGANRIYVLDGNMLYDQAFDNEISLTNVQLNDLLVALELADY